MRTVTKGTFTFIPQDRRMKVNVPFVTVDRDDWLNYRKEHAPLARMFSHSGVPIE